MKIKWIAVGSVASLLVAINTSLAAEKHSHEHAPAAAPASEAMTAAEYTCPMHSEVVSDKPGSCPECGMNLVVKGAKHKHAESTITASFGTEEPLTVGKPAQVTVKLSMKDGTPVRISDLRVAHTKKIHLLVIDSSLADYHHEHPEPTGVDGEYSFSFTPRKPGPYRVWADLLPEKTGLQEYARADIAAPTKGEPLTDRQVTSSAEVDGLTYNLSWDQAEIVKGKPVMGKLMITGSDEKPFTQLEPIMGAFAHIVGFSEDYETAVHIHPMGKEPDAATDRGGPELEFHLVPEEVGFIHLFAQVQIGGVSKFAPFGLAVNP